MRSPAWPSIYATVRPLSTCTYRLDELVFMQGVQCQDQEKNLNIDTGMSAFVAHRVNTEASDG
jgi:hypothetical protein